MKHLNKIALFCAIFLSFSAQASMLPEYADNSHAEHSLSRSDTKCINEGYKQTYGSCKGKTAPQDRCPHSDNYYRSCTKKQWCLNNNYTYSAKNCSEPLFPIKKCANGYKLYRACKTNNDKACRQEGYKPQNECQLTDERCPYDSTYGKCCDSCPNFSHYVDKIPEGYIAHGPVCITCDGLQKTNIIENPCDGFSKCSYGPKTPDTPFCLRGKDVLYSECKTSEKLCIETGYTKKSCSPTEDIINCPQNTTLKKCVINCKKHISKLYPDAQIIIRDAVDPEIDETKQEIRSTYGIISKECNIEYRPEITININYRTYNSYINLFKKNISNINFVINFEDPIVLPVGGILENVKIKVKGNAPDCSFQGDILKINDTVSFIDAKTICANIEVRDSAKFITTGNVKGNITAGQNSSVGIRGNLNGLLKTKSFAEVFIKGTFSAHDPNNTQNPDGSIIFGCDTRTKVTGGIMANIANIVIKRNSTVDTPFIKLHSITDNKSLPNTLSSIHIHKYSKLMSVYGKTEFPMIYNNSFDCDDKYYIHYGSYTDISKQDISIEPASFYADKWQCQKITRQQANCD